jgi:nucleotide-binding universal stress UspA family protein
MGVILCATRGGEASLETQDAAIALAKQAGDELIFIYVYDVEFLTHANYALREDLVADELNRMAEFLMTMAVDRAKAQGLSSRSVVREGEFRAELLSALQEEQARLLILGRPGEDDGRFALEHLSELARRLQEESGIPVRILPD